MIKIKLGPNPRTVEVVKDCLEKNDGYCPCRLSKTEDTKCMCKEFRDFVAAGNVGLCHCGLYEAYDADKE